ncbi:hypothetical protein [Streptomyces sp. NPDC127098]|uniref:hypothetical protein n=1 Tax=Streptomyces sp. NPDC127098 TaxID=3347137 RepID=UPI003647C3BC
MPFTDVRDTANRTDLTRVSRDMRFSFKGARTRADGVELMNTLTAALPTSQSERPGSPGRRRA